MSLEDAEVPDSQLDRRLGPESLGPVTRLNRGLYFAVIAVLGAVLLVGVIGWLLLAAGGKTMPEGLGVILGTVAGALVAMVTDSSKR
jgi:hypothetical protein